MKTKVVSRLALVSSAAVLFTAACSSVDGPASKIGAPDGVASDFGVSIASLVQVCISATSPGTGYSVAYSNPTNVIAGDVVTVGPSILAPGDCVTALTKGNQGQEGPVWPSAFITMTVTPPGPSTASFTCVADAVESHCGSGVSGTGNVATAGASFPHGSQVTFDFVGDEPPPETLFLILDEDAIDNGSMPNKFTTKNVNDDIAKLGQRLELRWFAANAGATIVLHSGGMGDEGWFAPKTIPTSWVSAGPTTDGLRNFIGLPVGPGLGTGSNPESRLDKIPNVTPLRAEGLYMLIGKTVCAVVYDSDISINYGPLNGSLKGANLGIVAFTVDNVQRLTGYSSSSLPKVTITVVDADEACGTEQQLFLDAPVISDSGKPVDVIPNGAG
jgi:hypothetical protein